MLSNLAVSLWHRYHFCMRLNISLLLYYPSRSHPPPYLSLYSFTRLPFSTWPRVSSATSPRPSFPSTSRTIYTYLRSLWRTSPLSCTSPGSSWPLWCVHWISILGGRWVCVFVCVCVCVEMIYVCVCVWNSYESHVKCVFLKFMVQEHYQITRIIKLLEIL